MIYDKRTIPADLQRYFVRAEVGLEQSPDEYVARLVEVFREARRVLADTGTMWLNIGDSYSSGGGAFSPQLVPHKRGQEHSRRAPSAAGCKTKDLIGIPWLLAFALRADGWYLRQDIIWGKANPMPESVTDRCTKAHEYVFLLSKQARYWYDAKAVAEPAEARDYATWAERKDAGEPNRRGFDAAMRPGNSAGLAPSDGMRNRRSVWTIATQPCAESHYAVMPVALAEICIKAGCEKGKTVLDPFGGAGTTALAALRHGRKAVLIELSPENCEMARRRIEREWRVPQRQEHAPIGGLFGDAA